MREAFETGTAGVLSLEIAAQRGILSRHAAQGLVQSGRHPGGHHGVLSVLPRACRFGRCVRPSHDRGGAGRRAHRRSAAEPHRAAPAARAGRGCSSSKRSTGTRCWPRTRRPRPTAVPSPCASRRRWTWSSRPPTPAPGSRRRTVDGCGGCASMPPTPPTSTSDSPATSWPRVRPCTSGARTMTTWKGRTPRSTPLMPATSGPRSCRASGRCSSSTSRPAPSRPQSWCSAGSVAATAICSGSSRWPTPRPRGATSTPSARRATSGAMRSAASPESPSAARFCAAAP